MAIPAKAPAATKNVEAIEAILYTRKIVDKLKPIRPEYRIKSASKTPIDKRLYPHWINNPIPKGANAITQKIGEIPPSALINKVLK